MHRRSGRPTHLFQNNTRVTALLVNGSWTPTNHALPQDAKDNKIFEQTKLPMPVFAVGGEKSLGAFQAVIIRHVATNVQEAVVVGSGHWLMEERPTETVALIRNFLDAAETKRRVSPR